MKLHHRHPTLVGALIGIGGAIALLLLAVLGVEALADSHSANTPVAPPAWMENITSACGTGPVTNYRVFAYNGVPFDTHWAPGDCS